MTAKKKTKPAPKRKPAAKRPSKAIPCPHGGDHEWEGDANERACRKCHEPETSTAKPASKTKPPKPAKAMSALDAAAKLLADSSEPLNCKELIDGIAAKGYWKSPGGKTPHSTLYAALMREINEKGASSRFCKASPGRFARTSESA